MKKLKFLLILLIPGFLYCQYDFTRIYDYEVISLERTSPEAYHGPSSFEDDRKTPYRYILQFKDRHHARDSGEKYVTAVKPARNLDRLLWWMSSSRKNPEKYGFDFKEIFIQPEDIFYILDIEEMKFIELEVVSEKKILKNRETQKEELVTETYYREVK